MALKEKMQQLRESVPQVGKAATRDAPSTYRINAINPAQDIDDQWALIDTPHNYGSRGPHQGVRKIRVGDELPQGSVVSITAEGIQVLPNFEGSEEYVIPFGGSYEPPPGEKTPMYDYASLSLDHISDLTRRIMDRYGTPDPVLASLEEGEGDDIGEFDPETGYMELSPELSKPMPYKQFQAPPYHQAFSAFDRFTQHGALTDQPSRGEILPHSRIGQLLSAGEARGQRTSAPMEPIEPFDEEAIRRAAESL